MTRYFTLALLLSLAACKDKPVKVKTVVQEVKPDAPGAQNQVTLTEKLIDNTEDEDLVNQLLYYFETYVPPDAAKDLPEQAPAINHARQFFLISLIQAEVQNGGFNQYYYNQRHLTIKHLTEAFKIIGAERYAALMKKANDTYQKHYKQITKSQDGSENLEYAVGPFTLTPAQRVIVVPAQVPLYSKHRIEGFFKSEMEEIIILSFSFIGRSLILANRFSI